MKSKCCNVELKEVTKSTAPPDPVMGQSYPRYIIYYYCSKCGLMYKFAENNSMETLGKRSK